MELSPEDKILLDYIQREFPLISRPFEEIGKDLGMREEEVLARLKNLKERQILRQISPIYDTKKLGYQSALVAFQVPLDQMERTVSLVNSHPGVSHNYERKHKWNLWFTLAVPPDSRLGLRKTVECLAQGKVPYLFLPTLRTFKIRVHLSFGEGQTLEKRKQTRKPRELTERDKSVIRLTQQDLPLTSRPFLLYAQKLSLKEEKLLELLREYLEMGWMRRFAGLLRHRKAGFRANAMVVWKCQDVERAGSDFAKLPWVSHCYERPTSKDWLYPLFTMIHAREERELENYVKQMSSHPAVVTYELLTTVREFKKVRLPYFTEEYSEWEQQWEKWQES